MSKWDIIKPYLITWIIFEVLAVLLYFIAIRDRWVFPIMINVAMIPVFIIMLSELFKKCPICGKRHLLNQVRCGGDRYTLFDAYCPVHNKWIDITWDRHTGKMTYLTKDDNERWCTKVITPIWEQKKKEKWDFVFRNIQQLEIEKDNWTAKDVAEMSNCSVRYAKKVIKELNI